MTLRCLALAGLGTMLCAALPAAAREHGHRHGSHSRHGKKDAAPVAAPAATEPGEAPPPPVIRPEAAPVDTAASDAFNAGVEAISAGRLEEAIPLLLKAAETAKPEPKIWYLLGRAYGKLGRFEEGRNALRKYISIEPTTPESDIADKLLKDFDVLEHTGFLVTSTPSGARFALDTPTGPHVTSPGVLHGAAGAHKIFVTLEGYEPATIEETTRNGDQVPVTATLVPIGCDVTAEVTVPMSGATVRVDEGTYETVPGPVRMPRGRHEIEIRPVGGEPITRDMVCKNNEPLKLSVNVPAPEMGRVTIMLPGGTRATIDGTEVKVLDGRASRDLPPGEHLVDVEGEGKVPWHAAVMVRPAEALDVTPTLEAGGGTTGIEVRSDPDDAAVTIDGRDAKSGQTLKVQPGKHQISVRARGHLPVLRTVDVIAGERSHVEVRLEHRSRYLLWLGLGAIPVALAAEGLALAGHFNAGGELANSTQWQRWHSLEVSGHIIAGAAAIVAAGSLTGYLVQMGMGDPGTTTVGAAITPSGGALVLSRSF